MGAACSGAFKFRGAFNSVQQLSEEQAAKGVVTHRYAPCRPSTHVPHPRRTLAWHDLLTPEPLHLLACCSSGNHAAALALAAKLRGIPAYIVVPNNAPACKLAAVKEYGGEQVQVASWTRGVLLVLV